MKYLFFLNNKSISGTLSSSKQFPPILTHLDQHPSHCWKVLEFFVCKRLRCLCRVATRLITSTLLQWTFFNTVLTFGNAQKSHGAISGEYRVCDIWIVPFFANQSATTCDICGGALLWQSTQLLVANSSGLTQAIRVYNCFRIQR